MSTVDRYGCYQFGKVDEVEKVRRVLFKRFTTETRASRALGDDHVPMLHGLSFAANDTWERDWIVPS
jgi:hypothetical protein